MENNKSIQNPKSLKGLIWLLLILPLGSGHLFSQPTSYTKYFIQFTDKNNSPYSISNPSAFLSARAMQRRTNQGIAVVQNDLPVNPAYIDSVKKIPNITVLNRSKWFNGVVIATTDTNALHKVQSFPFVLKSKPVRCAPKNGKNKFDEEASAPVSSAEKKEISTLSGYNYGPSFNQINMLNGVCLHNKGFHGEGMMIAVMDAGFWKADSLPAFDSLRVNKQILGKWNFVDNDSLVYGTHTHGEMTLSTMGGNMPGRIVGTAPKAKYWLFITEDSGGENVIEEYNWTSAAEFADSVGADVFSTSLGYTTFDSVKINNVTVVNPANHSYSDMNGKTAPISIASAIAASKGILPVCSAGNSGTSPWHFIGAPADADSTLTIAAVDSLKNIAGFSSRGPSYDGRIKPNVAAQGQSAVVGDPNTGDIQHASGTSFSCPIMAGMVACLWQAHPASANMALINAIQQSANRHLNPDSLTGYGIPDFCMADILLGINELSAGTNEVLSVYPSPFRDGFDISFVDWKGEKVSFVLYDIMGRKILDRKISTNAGISTLEMKNLDWLQAGVYVLTAETSRQTYSMKVVKY
ncbi:MAG: S8 family peptidase [Bacteroidia bacterium]